MVTICLTKGSPEAGELRFLPGSHRASFPFIDGTDVAAPEGASLPITAGDMTVHYSDVMHASLSPTSVDGPTASRSCWDSVRNRPATTAAGATTTTPSSAPTTARSRTSADA